MDKVRCPACRGAKKVPKLGGMIGECNTCKGEGRINEADKPKPVVATDIGEPNAVVIQAVANSVPCTTLELKSEPEIKVSAKTALYKRKTSSK